MFANAIDFWQSEWFFAANQSLIYNDNINRTNRKKRYTSDLHSLSKTIVFDTTPGSELA